MATKMPAKISLMLGQVAIIWNDDIVVECYVRKDLVEATPDELRKIRKAMESNIQIINKALIARHAPAKRKR